MGKKGNDSPVEEVPKPEEEEEPEEPEILKLCFRTGCQLYYGDSKAGYKQRLGTFVRHGFGKLVQTAIAPAGVRPSLGEGLVYETVVLATYDGHWTDDGMTGPGTCKWSDGSSYEGAFAAGRMHGHGCFLWPDGSSYEGAWHEGAMHGHGRFDSRFDGSTLQGRFYKNLFQTKDSSWVDILARHQRSEQDLVLRPDGPWQLQVRTCAFRGSSRAEHVDDVLREIQAAGFVPFLLTDESLKESPLEFLRLDGQLPDQCVSIRLAAVMKRRKGDFHSLFFDAIQASLRGGSRLALVLEDDDSGLALADSREWLGRAPSPEPPRGALPQDWQIRHFFDPDMFPVDVFRPQAFNAHNAAKLFLPEVVKAEKEAERQRKEALLAEERAAEAAKAKAEAEAAAAAAAAADPKAKAKAKAKAEPPPDTGPSEEELAEQERVRAEAAAAAKEVAAAAMAAASTGAGFTGHFFGPGLPVSPQKAGMPAAHFLRPAVVATGRVPGGLSEADARQHVLERYGAHLPLHRTAVVLLTGGGDA